MRGLANGGQGPFEKAGFVNIVKTHKTWHRRHGVTGFAQSAAGIAANIRRALGTGVAGISLEDASGIASNPVRDLGSSIARLQVARRSLAARLQQADFQALAHATSLSSFPSAPPRPY